ncbi:MAG TPA: hypothetical protein VFW09_07055 [Solirubrobacteraceae bacterium]|nr:hypothetical protein [Solirubrobacteraceae bacterium]
MVIATATVALAASGCGGSGSASSTTGPAGQRVAAENYPIAVSASFPRRQSLAQRVRLVLAVRNTGRRALPNVAVSICNTTCSYKAPRGEGTTVQAFSYAIGKAPNLANASRPIWIVLRPPGKCGYSCRNLGPGAAVTAYSNTWALGRLAPGHTARFVWTVTPVRAGRFTVAWQVAAALNGHNRAVLAGNKPARGTIVGTVSPKPPHYIVQPNGKVTTKR